MKFIAFQLVSFSVKWSVLHYLKPTHPVKQHLHSFCANWGENQCYWAILTPCWETSVQSHKNGLLWPLDGSDDTIQVYKYLFPVTIDYLHHVWKSVVIDNVAMPCLTQWGTELKKKNSRLTKKTCIWLNHECLEAADLPPSKKGYTTNPFSETIRKLCVFLEA